MSYCRWSSDNWRCDLYCYESSYGYTTHVASNRIVGDIPPDPLLSEVTSEEWMARHAAVREFLRTAEHRPIGLPHDGESFDDPDLHSFYNRLVSLRDLGYNVPAYVLDEVRDEIRESLPEQPSVSLPGSP